MLSEHTAILCHKCLAYLVVITLGTKIHRQIHRIYKELRMRVICACGCYKGGYIIISTERVVILLKELPRHSFENTEKSYQKR